MPRSDTSLSIYLHIPFCSVRCSYCAFNTYTDLEHVIPAYVDALCSELALVADHCKERRVQTLYFGGGTPSLLTVAQFDKILSQLASRFSIDSAAEISLEANPDNLNETYLRGLRQLGFNRLSIGMQSANREILHLFDRRHDMTAVETALASSRRAKFDNVNLDVIFASPGETLANWQTTVETVLRLSPEHISMYGLELKGGTRLRGQVDAGELPAPDDDLFADMYEYASGALEAAAYEQYEISNFCRPGNECLHNLQYWRNLDYIGVGAGAHGCFEGMRYSTIAAPGRYIAALENGSGGAPARELTPAIAKTNAVTRPEDLYETVMMGLRLTKEGINRARFSRRFGCDFLEVFPDSTAAMTAAGLLRVLEDRIRLSRSGRLLSNLVIRELVGEIT